MRPEAFLLESKSAAAHPWAPGIARRVRGWNIAALGPVAAIRVTLFAWLVRSSVVPLLHTDVLIRRPPLLVLLLRSRILNHRILPGRFARRLRSEIDARGASAVGDPPYAVITNADQSHDT